jgi:hypothetical protein
MVKVDDWLTRCAGDRGGTSARDPSFQFSGAEVLGAVVPAMLGAGPGRRPCRAALMLARRYSRLAPLGLVRYAMFWGCGAGRSVAAGDFYAKDEERVSDGGHWPPSSLEHSEKLMQHSLRKDAKLAAAVLIALSSVCVMTDGAVAKTRRYINGHVSLCGRGTIPVSMYAAERYYARPLVCGGAPVNDNLNPDFQLTRGGRR